MNRIDRLKEYGLAPSEEVPCPECDGEGYHEVQRGYTQHGPGYGDCSPKWKTVACEHCDGQGVVTEELG